MTAKKGTASATSKKQQELAKSGRNQQQDNRYQKLMTFNEQVLQCEFDKAERMLKRAEKMIKRAKNHAMVAVTYAAE